MTIDLRPGFIRTRTGADLAFKDWGAGRPLLFLHPWGLPSDMWMYVMAALSEQGCRCVAYDRRGHGRSVDPGRGNDFDTLADDLADVIQTLDLDGVTLVGMSFAAGEMVRYLTRHGDRRIASLVFVAPSCTPFLLKTDDNPGGIESAQFEALRRQFATDYLKWLDDNARPFVVPETSIATIDWVKALMAQASLKALLDLHRVATTTDFRPELPRIARPTLVIHGDRDVSAPLELTGRPTAAMIPGARLEVYAGAPHGLPLTHRDRLIQDLLAVAAAGW